MQMRIGNMMAHPTFDCTQKTEFAPHAATSSRYMVIPKSDDEAEHVAIFYLDHAGKHIILRSTRF